MASIWSRNKIWGGTFTTDVDVADGTNNASVVPATSYLGLNISTEVDPEGRNRTKWFTSVIGQVLRAVLHKEEDRDSVTATPSTLTKYVAKDQLPEITSVVNDMTDGSDTAGNINMFDVATDVTGINKLFKLSFSSAGLVYLKARTRTEAETVTLVNNTIYGEGTTSGLIPVGTVWDYTGAYNVDPSGFLNLCNEYSGSARSISNTAGTGTLHDDKYQALFLHLWTNFANTECPVSSGRGASAAADWAANKDIKLPDYRGRVGGYYKSGDTNFGTLGKQIGTDLIEAAHLPLNSPWNIVDTHQHTYLDNAGNGQHTDPGNGDGGKVAFTNDIGRNTTGTTGSIILNTNVSTDRKHFQPTIIQTAIIKY